MQKVLLVCNNFPHENNSGSEQRTNHIYHALAGEFQVDWLVIKPGTVHFISGSITRSHNYQVAPIDVPKQTKWLPIGIKGIAVDWLLFRQYNRFNADAFDFVKHLLKETNYSWVLCRYLSNYIHVGLFKWQLSRQKLILDLDDLPWKVNTSRQRVAGLGRFQTLKHTVSNYLIKKRIYAYLNHAAKLLVSNPNDAKNQHLNRCFLLGNIPWHQGLNQVERNYSSFCFLFVANLKYGPNLEGLYHFAKNIWPCIKKNSPEAIFQVIGNYEEGQEWIESIKKMDGIYLLGYVDNLEPFYEKAKFCISPVYWGGGTKIKVLESLYFGKTIVVTPHSLDGYETQLKNGESLMLANSDVNFCELCVQLLRDQHLSERMGRQGKLVCEQYFSFDNFKKQLHTLLQ